MNKFSKLLFLLALSVISACADLTDAATRFAYDIEEGENRLGKAEGDKYSIQHKTPSKPDECTSAYKMQLDKVGAFIIWCYDATGKTLSSHSTSYHARFIDSPQTYILDKPAGSTLTVDLERRAGRAVVADVR